MRYKSNRAHICTFLDRSLAGLIITTCLVFQLTLSVTASHSTPPLSLVSEILSFNTVPLSEQKQNQNFKGLHDLTIPVITNRRGRGKQCGINKTIRVISETFRQWLSNYMIILTGILHQNVVRFQVPVSDPWLRVIWIVAKNGAVQMLQTTVYTSYWLKGR